VSREPGEGGTSAVPARVGSRLAFAALALLVGLTIGATVAGSLSLSERSSPIGSPPSPTAAPTDESAPPTAAPADPRSVFRDPALRALAESFLARPGVSCEQREPGVNVTESVACDLGRGRIGLFNRMLTADVMRDLRRGFVEGRLAEQGSVRSLRWRYVDGRPGTRTGVPAGQDDPVEGVRVRFVDPEGVPRLYFDQDSSGCTGYLALAEPTGNDDADLETLRSFWADPAR
jgi:hypothetical protein